jgi:hypothetical protein
LHYPKSDTWSKCPSYIGYLKIDLKRKLAFHAQHPVISERIFKKCDWSDFYRGVEEAIPGDMPTPRGNANVNALMQVTGATGQPEGLKLGSSSSVIRHPSYGTASNRTLPKPARLEATSNEECG